MSDTNSHSDGTPASAPAVAEDRWRILLILITCAASWLAMMIVHELGHVLAGVISGGTVTKVVLHPLAISRTDVEPNPHPLFVVWAGPVFGACVPAIIWYLAGRFKTPFRTLIGFFVGFCLIANGAYLAVGCVDPVGDAKTLIELGTSTVTLGVVGALMLTAGLQIWHELGKWVGFAEIPSNTLFSQLVVAFATLGTIVVLELLFSERL